MNKLDKFSNSQLKEIVQRSKSYNEVLRLCGYKSCNGNSVRTLKRRLLASKISTSHFTSALCAGTERTEENVFCKNSTASQAVVRRWFAKGNYAPYECSRCHISTWNGEHLVLQLDHIDGDNSNNDLGNLRWLCPNCHSQTETFCGKQKVKAKLTQDGVAIKIHNNFCIDCGKQIKDGSTRCSPCAKLARRKVKRPSKEELLDFLLEHNGNFTDAERQYGVSANAVRRWCKRLGLSNHTNDYKSA